MLPFNTTPVSKDLEQRPEKEKNQRFQALEIEPAMGAKESIMSTKESGPRNATSEISSSPLTLGLSMLAVAIFSFIIGFLGGENSGNGSSSLAEKYAGPLPALASSTIIVGLEYEKRAFDVELLKLVCDTAQINCAAVLAPRYSIIPDAFSDWMDSEASKNTAKLPGRGFYEGWFNCVMSAPYDPSLKQLLRYTHLYQTKMGFLCHPARADMVEQLNDGLAAVSKNGKLDALCKKHGSDKCGGDLESVKAVPTTFPDDKTKADVIIGVDVDWAPWSFINEEGEIKGFDMEMLPLVCKEAGLSCTLLGIPFQSTIPGHWMSLGIKPPNLELYPGEGYQNGWFHCSAGQRTTPDRLETFAFSDPYTDPNQESNIGVFIGRSGEYKHDDSDVQGKTIGVQSGSVAQIFLARSKLELTLKTMQTPTELFAALKDGSVDAVFFTKGELHSKFFDAATMQVMGPKGEKISEGMALMCHPSRFDIVEKLNVGLRKLKRTSSWSALCSKTDYVNKIHCDLNSTGDKAIDNMWQFKY